MSTKILDNVNLMLHHHKAARVSSKNEYVFGIESTTKGTSRYLRACVLMRKFPEECGADNASSLKGTTLRKHIATRCVDMELTDNQISRVANFMGHHENIHRSVYKQPVMKVDIVDMSKVLEKAQGIDVSTTNGCNSTGIDTSDERNSAAGCLCVLYSRYIYIYIIKVDLYFNDLIP